MTVSFREPDRPRLRDLDAERHLRDPRIKQRYVTTMFDLIAPKYDRFTRWFSYGMDRWWKREMLDVVGAVAPPAPVILDIACGTGDLAEGAAAHRRRGVVIGVDPSRRMLEHGRQRIQRAGGVVRFCLADMTLLPAADQSVDLVTVGYGLRNAPDFRVALGEIARVLKRDGRLVSLDFYQPENPVWGELYVWYLSTAGNVYGWLWHREPAAYGYIARSVRHFVTVSAFNRILEETGFAVERVRRKLLGGIGIHVARRK